MAGEVNPPKPQPKPQPQQGKGTLHVNWAYHYQQAHPVMVKDYQLDPGTYNWLNMNMPTPPKGRVYINSSFAMTNPNSADPRKMVIKANQTTNVNVIIA